MKWKQWLAGPFLRNEEGGEGGGGGGGSSLLKGGAGGGEGGSGGSDPWYHTLPEPLRTSGMVINAPDLQTFVKSAIDTKAMVGANTIKLPGEKATDEERAAFWKQLGRPDDAKGYEPTVKPAVEGMVSGDILDKMRGVFHQSGMTTQQGQAVLDAYLGIMNESHATVESQKAQAYEQGVATLKQEWGQDFEVNVKTAQLAVRELGGDQILQTLEASGLANDPAMIKFLHAVGTKLLDDDASGSGEGRFTGSAAAARQEIERLKSDSEFQTALNTGHHPAHASAVERWTNLHRQAFPGKQSD